jgi:hypothetical protein
MKTCFSYYHTFGLTENYLLMIEQPWVANSLKLIASKVKGGIQNEVTKIPLNLKLSVLVLKIESPFFIDDL